MKYEDLDERAKERARNAWRECDRFYDWWQHVYADVITTGKLMGIDIDKRAAKTVEGKAISVPDISFNIGEGASFSASLYVAQLKGCVERVATHIGNLNAEHPLYELVRGGEGIYELIVAHWTANRLSGLEEHEWDYGDCRPEMVCIITDRQNEFTTRVIGGELPDVIDAAMDEFVNAYAGYIHKQLEAEDEYLNSDAYVIEAIANDDTDFDEYGNSL